MKRAAAYILKPLSSAQMVELVDTPDLGSGAARHVGSSPILGKTFRFDQKATQ